MIKRLARYNIYINRSKQYVGTIHLFISLSILVSVIPGLQVEWWYYVIAFFFSLGIFIVFGYLDVKFNIMSEEQKFYGDKNPIFNEFFERLERIEKKL